MTNALEINSSTFKTEVLDSKQTTVVDFWAPWCGPCKMMAPVLDSLARKLINTIKITKLNTDENTELAAQYQITGIPCLIVFKGGAEVERIVGFHPEAELEGILLKHV